MACRDSIDDHEPYAINLSGEPGERHVCPGCWDKMTTKEQVDVAIAARTGGTLARLVNEIITRLDGTHPYFQDRGEN